MIKGNLSPEAVDLLSIREASSLEERSGGTLSDSLIVSAVSNRALKNTQQVQAAAEINTFNDIWEYIPEEE